MLLCHRIGTLRAVHFVMKLNRTNPLWLPLAAAVGLVGNVSAQDAALVAKGKELFQAKICFTCHEVSGGPPALAGVAMKAPKFEGNFWGKERIVTLGFGGKDAKVTFDEAYFIESIRKPIDKVVKSAAAPMPPPPAVNDEEMKALIAYVKSGCGHLYLLFEMYVKSRCGHSYSFFL